MQKSSNNTPQRSKRGIEEQERLRMKEVKNTHHTRHHDRECDSVCASPSTPSLPLLIGGGVSFGMRLCVPRADIGLSHEW
jgi:hypothetical protein